MILTNILINHLFVTNIAVIIDILGHKSIQSGVISHCYDPKTALFVHKKFQTKNLRMSSINVNKNNISIPHHYERLVIVVDASCKGWENIFSSLDATYAFKNPFVWVITTDNLTETTDILSQYKIELNSDVTIIAEEEGVFNLYEVFHTGFNKNGRFITRPIGRWDKDLYMENKDRKDLKGLVVKSTVVIPQSQRVVNKTFLRFLEDARPDLHLGDPLHKFKFYTALTYFQDMFNITYDFTRTVSWGYHVNGNFDGMVGSLQRREIEIGGSAIFVRADRSEAVDYAVITWQSRPCFIFRHPKHPGGYSTIYTRPLTADVWYCIIGLMLISSIILGALLKMNIISLPGKPGDISLSLAFLCIWSALCQQGSSIPRSSTSIKIVMFVSFLYAVTLYQYYNATVVSTLLREPPKNIRTLDDLVQSNLKVGVEDILYNKDYFKRTTDPIAINLYHKKVDVKNTYNYFEAEHGMALVKKGGFAFHMESTQAYRIMRRTFTENELCEMQEINMMPPQPMGVAVVKGSPFKELAAYGIRKMKERGLMSRLLSMWDEPRPPCVRTPDSSIFSVNLKEFSSAIIVLVLGYFVAFLILAGEIIHSRSMRVNIEFKH